MTRSSSVPSILYLIAGIVVAFYNGYGQFRTLLQIISFVLMMCFWPLHLVFGIDLHATLPWLPGFKSSL